MAILIEFPRPKKQQEEAVPLSEPDFAALYEIFLQMELERGTKSTKADKKTPKKDR